ncbi:MAG: glycosyltransferase family 4 protein, partial [Bacteroidota bacterium]
TRAKVLHYGHDLHFMRTLKQNEIDNKKGLQEEAEKWRQIEFSLFDKSDLVLAPSEAEKSLIRQMEISTPIYAIKPYSFDIIPDPVSDFSVRKDILFVGGFTHIPNVDAVIWFVREVWPKMRNKLSGGRFIVAGSNVPPEIAALATEDINVVGFLPEPDLQKLYKTIKLVVVPLRYGAGVKGKTVEAMYHGIPLVTTSFGIEGLPGDTSFISPQNNATDFSSELIRLYNAPDEELATLSNKEADYVKEHFHFNVVKAEMIGILEKLKHK